MKILITGARGSSVAAWWRTQGGTRGGGPDPPGQPGSMICSVTTSPCSTAWTGWIISTTWTSSSIWPAEPIAAGRWSESRKQLLCSSRWLLTEQLVDLIKLSGTPQAAASMPPPSAGMVARGCPLDETCQTPHDEFTHRLCQQWGAAGPAGRYAPDPGLHSAHRPGARHGGGPCPECCPYRLGLGGPMGSSAR